MPTATATLMGSQTPTFEYSSKNAIDFKDSEKLKRFMKAYGGAIQLDPWQEGLLHKVLARDKNGLLVHKTCGILVPRQNGKGAVIEARVLYGVIVLKEDIVVTSHHLGTTKNTFERICAYFENPDYPEIQELVKTIRRANGQLAIELKNGASVSFTARSKGANRGRSYSLIIYDEAQELGQEAHAALLPTIASRKDSQVLMLGTPDTGTSDSEVFNKVRATGHKKRSKTVFYAEWSASPESDPEDPDVWAATNPALGRRLTLEGIQAEFDSLPERDFFIERLGAVLTENTKAVIPSDLWNVLMDSESTPEEDLVLAVDVSPARSNGTIAIAGRRTDGKIHVEFVDHRADGIAWIIPRLKALVERHNIRTVVIDGKGPASTLEEQISKIRGVRVKKMSYQDVAAACGLFYDAVIEGNLIHLSQPALNIAVANGRKRNLNDAWAWSRAHAGADITPLVAVTNAFWACQSSKVRKKKSGTSSSNTKRRILVF